jgi:hypothetical protein
MFGTVSGKKMGKKYGRWKITYYTLTTFRILLLNKTNLNMCLFMLMPGRENNARQETRPVPQ